MTSSPLPIHPTRAPKFGALLCLQQLRLAGRHFCVAAGGRIPPKPDGDGVAQASVWLGSKSFAKSIKKTSERQLRRIIDECEGQVELQGVLLNAIEDYKAAKAKATEAGTTVGDALLEEQRQRKKRKGGMFDSALGSAQVAKEEWCAECRVA